MELLYHPILQVVILRKSNHDFSTAMHWREDNDVHSAFSARAFSGLVFQTLNWKRSCRYQCRGICRGRENAKFLIFELDESRILTGKNQYGIQFVQALLEANGLAVGKDHQFKGRYDAEKNAVIISLEKDEQSALSPQKCTT